MCTDTHQRAPIEKIRNYFGSELVRGDVRILVRAGQKCTLLQALSGVSPSHTLALIKAFYFVWLDFFSCSLLAPAVLGLLIWLMRPANENVDNDGTCIIALSFLSYTRPRYRRTPDTCSSGSHPRLLCRGDGVLGICLPNFVAQTGILPVRKWLNQ